MNCEQVKESLSAYLDKSSHWKIVKALLLICNPC